MSVAALDQTLNIHKYKHAQYKRLIGTHIQFYQFFFFFVIFYIFPPKQHCHIVSLKFVFGISQKLRKTGDVDIHFKALETFFFSTTLRDHNHDQSMIGTHVTCAMSTRMWPLRKAYDCRVMLQVCATNYHSTEHTHVIVL